MGGILACTVLYGWLYEATSSAAVSAVALHALLNVTGELLVTARTTVAVLGVHAALALAVVRVTGPRLRRSGR